MPPKRSKSKRIGLIGCGAIGGTLARKVRERTSGRAHVAFLHDHDSLKAEILAKSILPHPAVTDLLKLISSSDIIIEAASAAISAKVARLALEAGKDVLIMSVGGLIEHSTTLLSGNKRHGRLFIPSGAIGGLDALRAIRLERIDDAVLRTFKPPKALAGAPYFEEKGIDIGKIRGPQMVFSGSVKMAVKYFPQNINVAAALALALGSTEKLRVEIHCDPSLSRNIHEINVSGSFGRISFTAENVPSAENPKTSQLAVLSALSSLEHMLNPVSIGS